MWEPVCTLADLSTLNDEEIVEGYRDGLHDEPCGNNRSRSYWHGWMNARRDKGLSPISSDAMCLAHEYVKVMKEKDRAVLQ